MTPGGHPRNANPDALAGNSGMGTHGWHGRPVCPHVRSVAAREGQLGREAASAAVGRRGAHIGSHGPD